MEDPIVDVEILLCEGGDVERWLERRNISLCLRLDLFSQLSSLYLALLLLFIFIYMLDIVCMPTLVFNQESY